MIGNLMRCGILCTGLLASSAAQAVQSSCPDRWHSGDPIPGVNGRVFATATYDDGRGEALYVGGNFGLAGDVSVSKIARWDGQGWEDVGGGVDGRVRAMTSFAGALIVAGEFTMAGGVPAQRIAAWNGVDWRPLGAGTDGVVYDLLVWNGELMAAGAFETAGGVVSPRLALWDGESWSAFERPAQATSVNALGVFEGDLVIGGGLASQQGYVARRNGGGWDLIGNLSGWVGSLAAYNGDLIAAGSIRLGEPPSVHVARWDGDSWEPLGEPIGDYVLQVAVYDGDLIAIGDVGPFGGEYAHGIARWDGNQWERMEGGLLGGDTETLGEFEDELIVGGAFTVTKSGEARRIVRWNGDRWRALTPALNGSVHALHIHKGALHAGGSFGMVAGQDAGPVAYWSGDGWLPLPAQLASSTEYRASVRSLFTFEDDLIATGSFDLAGETVVNQIARWDGQDWQALGEGLGPPPWNSATSLVQHDGALVAAGQFELPGHPHLPNIARWDGKSWQPIGGGIPGAVWALAVYEGELIAGGEFQTLGNLVRWDGSQWTPLGGGVDQAVTALYVYRDELLVAGPFELAGGLFFERLAVWNGADWHGMGNPGTSVNKFVEHDGKLIAVTSGAPYVRRWTGNDWVPIGAGLDYVARAGASFDGDLFVGGSFTRVGGKLSPYWARWGALCERGDLNCDGAVDALDVEPFIAALTDPAGYSQRYPDCERELADTNDDGSIDSFDIEPFIGLLGP